MVIVLHLCYKNWGIIRKRPSVYRIRTLHCLLLESPTTCSCWRAEENFSPSPSIITLWLAKQIKFSSDLNMVLCVYQSPQCGHLSTQILMSPSYGWWESLSIDLVEKKPKPIYIKRNVRQQIEDTPLGQLLVKAHC